MVIDDHTYNAMSAERISKNKRVNKMERYLMYDHERHIKRIYIDRISVEAARG